MPLKMNPIRAKARNYNRDTCGVMAIAGGVTAWRDTLSFQEDGFRG